MKKVTKQNKSVKKITNKTKSNIKSVKKESNVKQEIKDNYLKEETVKQDKVVNKDKRYLLFCILYFACTIVWIIGAYIKATINIIYIFDIVIAILWFILAIIYFIRYNKGQ